MATRLRSKRPPTRRPRSARTPIGRRRAIRLALPETTEKWLYGNAARVFGLE